MDLNLRGKRALVCGSTQGIGLACAQELARLGADVTLMARNADKLTEAVKTLANDHQFHQTLCADFTDVHSVHNAIHQYLTEGKTIHILINNTGGPAPGAANTAKLDDFVAAFSQHLLCNQTLVQAVLPGMKVSGFGRIINVISTSVKQPIPNLGVSNTVRGAVANWAKTLAGELGPFGITVNNVLPGATKTGRLEAVFANKAQKSGHSIEQVQEEEKLTIPLRRFAEPSEFANAVAFLASPAASYITGINLPVDGGRTLSL